MTPFTIIDAKDAVRCIDCYVMDAASDFNAICNNLLIVAGDAELYRFYATIGDYTQGLCETVQCEDDTYSKQPWINILLDLDNEESELATRKASGDDCPQPKPPYSDALKACVEALVAQGMTDLDFDLALFAARTYGTQNISVYGKSYNLFMSRDYAELVEYTDENDKDLERLLRMRRNLWPVSKDHSLFEGLSHR